MKKLKESNESPFNIITEKRTCVICGKEFEVYIHSSRICCSDECSKERRRRYNETYRRQFRTSLKNEEHEEKKVCKKPKFSIDDVAKLARAAGMSYGQYVAMLKFHKMRSNMMLQ